MDSSQLNAFSQYLLSTFGEHVWPVGVGGGRSECGDSVADGSKTSNICKPNDHFEQANEELYSECGEINQRLFSALLLKSSGEKISLNNALAPTASPSSSTSSNLVNQMAAGWTDEVSHCNRARKELADDRSMDCESVEENSHSAFDECAGRKRKMSIENSSNKRRNIDQQTGSPIAADNYDGSSNGTSSEVENAYSESNASFDSISTTPALAAARTLFKQTKLPANDPATGSGAAAKDNASYLSPIMKLALQNDENKMIGE